MQFYRCPSCAARVYFENLLCLNCSAALGYVPVDNTMLAIDPAVSDRYQFCANRSTLQCNWLIDTTPMDAQPKVDSTIPTLTTFTLCDCCRYTQKIPPLDNAANQQALRIMEQAKRYLFYSLHMLHLPIPDRITQPDTGLAFEFLCQLPNEPKVLTGHNSGVITINLAEADDAKREQRRVSLHEHYRTVLGHLRHEVGHFYWDQLLASSELLNEFRTLFGDEREDYAAALQKHYQSTDSGAWMTQHISYYATAHPWEDWAETWAHYLHITDALDTAAAWGVALTTDGTSLGFTTPYVDMEDEQFCARLINEWLPLSQYLNAASRSLGEADAYPFTLPSPVVDKLGFVHRVLRASTPQSMPTGAQ